MSSENGAFSAYLIGTYETGRFGVGTVIHIVNPTDRPLEVIAAFFDDNGNIQACKKFHEDDDLLKSNGMKEIIVPLQVQGLKPKNGFGVVKIISHRGGQEAIRGIVGFQRQVLPNPDWKSLHCFSEANLGAVPMKVDDVEIANEELKDIISKCGYP